MDDGVIINFVDEELDDIVAEPLETAEPTVALLDLPPTGEFEVEDREGTGDALKFTGAGGMGKVSMT